MTTQQPLCSVGDNVFIRCGYRYVSAIVVKIDTTAPITKYYTNLNNNDKYFTEDDFAKNLVFIKN